MKDYKNVYLPLYLALWITDESNILPPLSWFRVDKGEKGGCVAFSSSFPFSIKWVTFSSFQLSSLSFEQHKLPNSIGYVNSHHLVFNGHCQDFGQLCILGVSAIYRYESFLQIIKLLNLVCLPNNWFICGEMWDVRCKQQQQDWSSIVWHVSRKGYIWADWLANQRFLFWINYLLISFIDGLFDPRRCI